MPKAWPPSSLAPCLSWKINFSGLATALAFMALIAFSTASLGLAIASKLDDFHGFQLIVNLSIMPLIFFSSASLMLVGAYAFSRCEA